MEAAKSCKRRLEHLKELDSLSPAAANQWKKKRIDRILVEYFLRAGYYNSAISLAKHSNIEVFTVYFLFENMFIYLYIFKLGISQEF